MLLDVRVDASVDQWNPGSVPHEPERGMVDDAGFHAFAPFGSWAEPEAVVLCDSASVS
ncbi:hypothetical protein [Micromonospora sp. M71_S20]|uniref:hypothetical protein n=1 Tax=Micromonospora sp. M71_S20 TaxID=592872 RepID=UPI0018F33051|nr:hypothetical protein [Micromonospora sp. M71_S20]